MGGYDSGECVALCKNTSKVDRDIPRHGALQSKWSALVQSTALYITVIGIALGPVLNRAKDEQSLFANAALWTSLIVGAIFQACAIWMAAEMRKLAKGFAEAPDPYEDTGWWHFWHWVFVSFHVIGFVLVFFRVFLKTGHGSRKTWTSPIGRSFSMLVDKFKGVNLVRSEGHTYEKVRVVP